MIPKNKEQDNYLFKDNVRLVNEVYDLNNLNDIHTCSVLYADSTTLNKPIDNNGYITTISIDDNHQSQYFKCVDIERSFQRDYKNNTWSSWTENISSLNILNKVNLNNIDYPCRAYCQHCANRPPNETGLIINNGYLDVMNINVSKAYAYQKYITYDGAIEYTRVKVNGTWQNWMLTRYYRRYAYESYIQNSWTSNGHNSIIRDKYIVFMQMTLRHGTDKLVMTLPNELKPTGNLLIAAFQGGSFAYLNISTNGNVELLSNPVYDSSGRASNLIFNASYAVKG